MLLFQFVLFLFLIFTLNVADSLVDEEALYLANIRSFLGQTLCLLSLPLYQYAIPLYGLYMVL